MAQWLRLLPACDELDPRCMQDMAFLGACRGGHLGVMQWLWALDQTFDIRAQKELLFRTAGKIGHLQMTQWLLSLDPEIDIHVNKSVTFRSACSCHDTAIIDLLIESTLDDSEIRYLHYQDKYYIIGSICTAYHHTIHDIPISCTTRCTKAQAEQVLDLISRKKSARSVLYQE